MKYVKVILEFEVDESDEAWQESIFDGSSEPDEGALMHNLIDHCEDLSDACTLVDIQDL